MKLSKLKGLTEEDNEPQVDVERIKMLKYASDKFVQTIHKYRKEYIFWKKIQIPEGELHVSIRLEDIPFTLQRYEQDKLLGEIVCSIDYIPKTNPKPVIPLNILQVSVSDFMDDLKEINPDLFNKPSIYPPDLLNCYKFKIQTFTMYPDQGILQLREYMDTPTYNIKVLTPHKLGSLLLSRSYLLNSYNLVKDDVPVFSDDYSTAMEKSVKKAKNVYHALKKGTWKGHTYELYKPDDWKRAFIVHHDRFEYNRDDKVIHPNFKITCNFGYEIVDGIKNSPENSPLSDEEQLEFRKFLKKRFETFDIGY